MADVTQHESTLKVSPLLLLLIIALKWEYFNLDGVNTEICHSLSHQIMTQT